MSTEFARLRIQAGLTTDAAASQLGYSERQIFRMESGEIKPRKAVLDSLRAISGLREADDRFTTFTFIDLFAGIGGLRAAFDAAGGRCVFTSEWDRFAQQTYEANYRDNRPIEGDITKIDVDQIPEHDVLVAGFPCQPFSIAGVSKKNALGRAHGFLDETQGTLFFDVARIIDHHRPAAFLLENVKNLKSHDKGRTFEVIRRTLEDELGYELHVKVVDARHFLPQHRERVVLVGFRDATSFSWNDVNLPEAGVSRMRDILHPEDGSEVAEGHFTLGADASVNEKYTLSDKLWQYLQNYAAKHKAAGNGFGFGLVGPNDTCRTLSARYYKDGSEILIDRGAGKNPRRLTPRECARLMGFPESFRIPVSDTQAYKQFGNSVAVPVFKAVAKAMQPHLFSVMSQQGVRLSA
ncbi:DNA (cytosine-5-)-methyltransferase [Ponticaulis sp.]|uniref:DNA (cytosine-5-)-methyltransferase n=1 Tax=Ponticaulis sp. TaxID=2020902 RepID=UPI000B6E6FFF|nr:DNA (cytosine-5-)-methyltransferase [Ponticaulis sp.]MAJ07811.1 DNA (cytosine-5-)-methyltransferase [Ponticaulis sp.]RPG18375.1 MAG: DNA (cytosine-5-)-methyltransferase [Hyphomonadaceae bacterium TMED125]HBH90508.1 DNA (cytosine-5-)-methyltransferase [Hyphomonadaceae bacterium]HBJ93558.1 DNA (cytosine-5-)-methyltransferase [Hyphomonadaceae bacterium]|tara:strand:- start:20084 stop:21307 length:1224 start_codon:yes stop_codon:yes gene_type:complete